MKFTNMPGADRIRTHIARVLSCVLLAGILYSTTFDAVHSHGPASINIAHNLTAQADAVSEVPPRGRSEGQACLICVLHRQSSNSIAQGTFLIVEPSTHNVLVTTIAVFHHSISFLSSPIARHSGRAPPSSQA